MKVEFKTLAAGPNGVFRPGTVHDVPETLAKQLVEDNYAEALEEPKKARGRRVQSASE